MIKISFVLFSHRFMYIRGGGARVKEEKCQERNKVSTGVIYFY